MKFNFEKWIEKQARKDGFDNVNAWALAGAVRDYQEKQNQPIENVVLSDIEEDLDA